jgi:hypothetical protein
MLSTFLTRREMLRRSSAGFGYLALAALASEQAAHGAESANPLAPKRPHFGPRAKRVIFLFMSGGPSQVDTFDPKPRLQERDGRPVPAEILKRLNKSDGDRILLASPWKFEQHGQGGLWFSELFPHLARQADKLCMIRSMHCDSQDHSQACQQIHTGATTFIRPSLGAWVLYGLGTEADSLPGFVSIGNLGRGGGPINRGSSFLPATFQGTPIGDAKGNPEAAIAHLTNRRIPRELQAQQMAALESLNRDFLRRWGDDSQIEGVIQSYELAFRMQAAAPEVLDLSRETPATLTRYGVGQGPTDQFGRNCLLARRMAEAGVRFIEVGGSGAWDHHKELREDLPAVCRATDQPISALLADLAERGMLDETLVLWGGEFGRTPENRLASRNGRDHDHHGYTMWLAGGGVKGGFAYGATDDFGYAAVENRVHIHDLHATILHLLGLDHERLTYRYSGRDFRLTDVHGRVVRDLLA